LRIWTGSPSVSKLFRILPYHRRSVEHGRVGRNRGRRSVEDRAGLQGEGERQRFVGGWEPGDP
jgi:hypothetical protein